MTVSSDASGAEIGSTAAIQHHRPSTEVRFFIPERRERSGSMTMIDFNAGAKLRFVVRALSGKPGDGTFIVAKATRKDAFETAIDLLAQSMSGVTITDEDGRIYESSNLADFVDGRP
jgi:hypothetical protein